MQPTYELPVNETPAGHVWATQQAVLLNLEESDERFPATFEKMRANNLLSLYLLPLTSAGRRLGALGFGRHRNPVFTTTDGEFLAQLTKLVAVAVDNALNFEQAHSAQRQLVAERDRSQLLLNITNAVVAHRDLKELMYTVSNLLRQTLHHDFATLALYDEANQQLRVHALDAGDKLPYLKENEIVPIAGTGGGLAIATRQPVLIRSTSEEQYHSAFRQRLIAKGLRSACVVPLLAHERVLGVITVSSEHENTFSQQDAELLSQIGGQIAVAVENVLAYQEIEELKNKLASEKVYLEEEIQDQFNFEEIIGQSQALANVLKQIEIVAPTDSTVLLLGETGTGKELVARAIHNLSQRRARTLVKLNCAAIPTGLLESELFGHEKGAFTGAVAQRIGRFELAHQGTLFLDEVGDIPLDLQTKLLRVLQEGEFERLGSTRTQKVNVRLIAATNADLRQLVAARQFRSDLFYRLNVFPIHLPPLRERHGDIPLLTRFFTQKFARRFRKPIETIPAAVLAQLEQWPWPGNVRELENFIERAVLLSRGSQLEIPLAELQFAANAETGSFAQAVPLPTNGAASATEGKPLSRASFADAERDLILQALANAHWVVGGPHGAAAQLGLKRTTLLSKMRKLGIQRPQ